MIDQIVFDPEVLAAVAERARTDGVARDVVLAEARRYAQEIVPSFSAYAYFGIGTRLARLVSTFLYRVRLGYIDREALAAVDADAAVIFVINHRSNLDYVLVTYMAASSSALSYAVGEWARVWLLQNLIRSMGAYFIHTNSRDPLYRKVLSRFVTLAVAGGLTQAMFPEGGLTRDGKLRPPKLGLLSYMTAGFDPNGARDAVFVPVGINYDRVLEDRIQIAGADGEKSSGARFDPWVFGAYLWAQSGVDAARAVVPARLCLRQFRRAAVVARLSPGAQPRPAHARSGAAVPGNRAPGPGTDGARWGGGAGGAGVADRHGVSRCWHDAAVVLELKTRIGALLERLKAGGAYVHIPRADFDYAVDVGLRMVLLRRLVVEEDGLYHAVPDAMAVLRYYANAIVHLPQPATPAERRPSASPHRQRNVVIRIEHLPCDFVQAVGGEPAALAVIGRERRETPARRQENADPVRLREPERGVAVQEHAEHLAAADDRHGAGGRARRRAGIRERRTGRVPQHRKPVAGVG